MRTYFTLAVLPKADGSQWSPQFGDYKKSVVEQELRDTRKDWTRGSSFMIIKTSDAQSAINAEIDRMNRELFKARNALV